MNVAGAIDAHARAEPGSPALLKDGWQMNHGELSAATQRVASILAEQGVVPSEVVGASIRGNAVLLLVVILALARLGAVLLPLNPGVPRSRRKAIAAHFKIKAIVAGRGEAGAGDARVIVADPSWLEPRAPEKAPPPSHPGGQHPLHIALTSGTTGTPKGVLRTHADLFESASLLKSLTRIEPGARLFCLMDLHNSLAIKRTLRHLSYGGAVVLADEDFGGGPPVERYGITHISTSPFMMQSWVKQCTPGAPRFETLKHLAVAGGAVSAQLARDIAKRITPNLYLTYGTTETDTLAIADPPTLVEHPGVTGRLVPWIEAEAVDESDRPLPAGESGVLRYRGKGVVNGYYGIAPEPGARAKAFRDGWFYPGDVGRITQDRLVYLEGRVDDIINLGGPKINAAAVEAALARHPSVREAAVFALVTPDGKPRLVAAVATNGVLDKAELVRYYRKLGGSFSELLRVVQVARLPRNAAGKVLKQELKRQIKFKPPKRT